jgi:hypothetical protein
LTFIPEKNDVLVLQRIEAIDIDPFLESLQFLALGIASWPVKQRTVTDRR